MLESVALVYMDEHVVQEVDAAEDHLALMEFADMLDGIIVKVSLDGADLVCEHQTVDQERTDLTEKYR